MLYKFYKRDSTRGSVESHCTDVTKTQEGQRDDNVFLSFSNFLFIGKLEEYFVSHTAKNKTGDDIDTVIIPLFQNKLSSTRGGPTIKQTICQ